MRFEKPLIPGRLLRRYKRFLAEVAFADGTTATVHCPNPGRMAGLDLPDMACWVSHSANPKRRLPLTLEMVWSEGTYVGVNTLHPNRLVAEAIASKRIAALAGYDRVRREVAYGTRARIDFLLEGEGRPPCYVEVKNVHWRRGELAAFPDAVTARGARHLGELATLAGVGHRACIVYVVQRADCVGVTVADDVDPAYGRAFRAALAAGVECWAHRCQIDPEEIGLDSVLPMVV